MSEMVSQVPPTCLAFKWLLLGRVVPARGDLQHKKIDEISICFDILPQNEIMNPIAYPKQKWIGDYPIPKFMKPKIVLCLVW